MSAIDRSSPMPLWAQLLAELRRRLASGEFADAFPTESLLTDEYGLSRHTVREAVRRLADEGLVDRERGRGTFVRPPVFEQPSGALYSLFRSIESQGVDQRSEVLDFSSATDPGAAARLGLGADARLMRLERLRLADGQPLAHDITWLPGRLARALLGVDFTHTALYDELANRCGVRPTGGTESISAVVPSAAERRLLKMGPRSAAFAIERSSLDGTQPIEWRTTTVRGDRFTFVARWSPGQDYGASLEPKEPVAV